jgi:hypothetical protein
MYDSLCKMSSSCTTSMTRMQMWHTSIYVYTISLWSTRMVNRCFYLVWDRFSLMYILIKCICTGHSEYMILSNSARVTSRDGKCVNTPMPISFVLQQMLIVFLANRTHKLTHIHRVFMHAVIVYIMLVTVFPKRNNTRIWIYIKHIVLGQLL